VARRDITFANLAAIYTPSGTKNASVLSKLNQILIELFNSLITSAC